MKSRNWSIRSKVVALVAVPVAALMALWLFATTLTVGPASSLLAARTLLDDLGKPGETLVAELQRERRLSMIYLASRADVPALSEQRDRTDRAVAEFRRRASGEDLRDAANDLLDARIEQTFQALSVLPSGRGFIDRREMDKAGALGLYTSMIESAFRSFFAMAALPDEEINRQARALTALGQAREVLGQADALVAGAIAAGRFTPREHRQLVQIIGTQRFLYATAVAELPGRDRAAYQRLIEGEAFVRLRAMEEELLATSGSAAPPVDARSWQRSYDLVQQQLRDFELAGADALAERSMPIAIGILARLGLAGVLGLVGVAASTLIALRVGRSLIRRLTGLRAAALDLAGARLPDVVARLRRGEDVDVAAEVPPLEYGTDEIGQLGHAFSEVQRTAVQSAVDEATVRHGLKEVFLNIARRSQTLLHRQLAVLDRMERRATDPEELQDLFLVDHMATRMRRHAEDLVILAGAAPGRGWRNPVPIVDVIRGAISEVEDYARVDLSTLESVAVAGRAVGDVIHLLAELIENATAYSPPHTRVQVTGQLVPNGYAIEIEDRGLGMTPEAIEEANERLAQPPDFDPANSARLGLFVVAQLGARHGVQVRLRASPYGGVTAVALVPGDLVVSSAAPDQPALSPQPARPAQPAMSTQPARPAVPVTAGAEDVAAQVPAISDDGVTQEIPRVTSVPTERAPAEHGGSERQVRLGTPSRLGSLPLRRARARTSDATAPAPPAAQRSSGADALPPLGPDGLPRRIRQGSLAPQLREPAAPPQASSLRSPEQVRSVMSALQQGTALGRRDAAALPGDVPDVVPASDGGSTDSGRDL